MDHVDFNFVAYIENNSRIQGPHQPVVQMMRRQNGSSIRRAAKGQNIKYTLD